MKKIILFAFLLSFFLISCQKNKKVTITTDIDDPRITQIELSNKIDMKKEIVKVSNSVATEIQVEKSGIYQIGEGRGKQYIYLSPGSSITINKGKRNPEFTVTGDLANEDALLKAFNKEMSIAGAKYGLDKLVSNSQEDFLLALEERYQKVNELLASKKGGEVDEDLIALLEKRVVVDQIQNKISYPIYYKYLNKREASLSSDYYDFVEGFDFDDEKLFAFEDVQNTAISLLSQDIDYSDDGDMGKFYREQFRLVNEKVGNAKIAELLKFNVINYKIAGTGGTSGMEKEIQGFIETAKDPDRKSAMENAVAKWAHLKVGSKAPDFSATTRDGKEVKLSDLKGKNVYIDVWATWCGPCIKEIPSLQKMEAKYHDENVEFVSVSIDKESDREKWMKFVEQRELGGTQIMTKNAWRSEIAQQYNIDGIPRFIMVDANGALVSADAPRPSNTGAFDNMLSSLLN